MKTLVTPRKERVGEIVLDNDAAAARRNGPTDKSKTMADAKLMNAGGGMGGSSAPGAIVVDHLTLNNGEKLDTLSTRTAKRKGSEWEILGNLEKGMHYTIKPKR